MNNDDYQRAALKTAGDASFTMLALGIAGEAGEVADLVKKVVGHGHALDRNEFKKELGDVLWYVAVLANGLNLSLGEIMEANIEKLKSRYPDGFSEERSKRRSQ